MFEQICGVLLNLLKQSQREELLKPPLNLQNSSQRAQNDQKQHISTHTLYEAAADNVWSVNNIKRPETTESELYVGWYTDM